MDAEIEIIAVENLVDMLKLRSQYADVDGIAICRSLKGISDEDWNIMQRELPSLDE